MDHSQTQQEHHHHHHHKHDSSYVFKQKSLNAIEFQKKLVHWLYITLWVIAIIMFCYVVYIYI